MSTITVGRENTSPITLSYEDVGQGPAVVLVHGWPLDSRSWEPQIHPLLAAGYRVITYDRRGFGRSSRPVVGYDFDTLADDLAFVFSGLDLHDAVIVGFSYGTGEVMRYVGRHGTDRLRAAVVIASLAPSFAQSPENPGGVDAAGVAGVQQAIVADRFSWLIGILADLLNLDEYQGTPVGDDLVDAMWSGCAEIAGGPHATCVTHAAEVNRVLLDFLDEPTLVIPRQDEAGNDGDYAI